MFDLTAPALALVAGIAGGVMNALAGGGTFATLPALIALGLPANIANATSNAALLPGAAASSWAFRSELRSVGGVDWRLLLVITFITGLLGSLLLVLTPGAAFDYIVPWLLLFAFIVIALGPRASIWLHARVSVGPRALLAAQVGMGLYGGYFGGGVGLMVTAIYGLLAHIAPRDVFAMRTFMLTAANLAAVTIFLLFDFIDWRACLPMLVGGILGGWIGASFGKRLDPLFVRRMTLVVAAAATIIFFVRSYG